MKEGDKYTEFALEKEALVDGCNVTAMSWEDFLCPSSQRSTEMFRIEEGCFHSVCDKERVSGQAPEQRRCSVKDF